MKLPGSKEAISNKSGTVERIKQQRKRASRAPKLVGHLFNEAVIHVHIGYQTPPIRIWVISHKDPYANGGIADMDDLNHHEWHV
jgi:hypothetical protein